MSTRGISKETPIPDRRYARLESQARSNELIWSGFHQIEVRLIGAQSLGQVVKALLDGLLQTFPRVDCVTLACSDPEYEMTRILEAEGNDMPAPGAFLQIGADALERIFKPPYRPRLGQVDADTRTLLFPEYNQPLGSVALAPLILHGRLIGSLNQGSMHVRHFTADTATDLLQHLAAVTAMCIENAVNHERLKQDGLTDALTGVSNRRFFERRLTEEIDRSLRHGEPLSCMVADIDHFKQVNDKYGHLVGDRVLRQVAEILGQDLRASDVLARYGGEEFVFLLPDTTLDQAAEIAERLRVTVERTIGGDQADQIGSMSISVGVACLATGVKIPDGIPGDWLFRQADEAVYRAKQGGRNRVEVAR